jgi:hypothetical protein
MIHSALGAQPEFRMNWPFKTTVKFVDLDGREQRLFYAVSADNDLEAKSELERRLHGQEIHAYTVESVVAVTVAEAARLKLPAGCVQLLGA